MQMYNCICRFSKHIYISGVVFSGEEDQNSTKNIVVRLSKSYAKHQPKKDNEIRPIPTQVSFHSMDKVLRPVEGKSNIGSYMYMSLTVLY